MLRSTLLKNFIRRPKNISERESNSREGSWTSVVFDSGYGVQRVGSDDKLLFGRISDIGVVKEQIATLDTVNELYSLIVDYSK